MTEPSHEPQTPDLARLEAALEDEFSGRVPPDYRHLAGGRTTRPRGLLVAALLLFGLGCVWIVAQQLLDEKTPDTDAPQPAQGRDARTMPPAIEVPDAATFARLAPDIQTLRIQVVRGESTRIDLEIPGEVPAFYLARVDRKALVDALLESAIPGPQSHKIPWQHVLSFELGDGRRVEGSLVDLDRGRKFALHVRGMRPLQPSAALVAMLRPELRRVESEVLEHFGVYNIPFLDYRLKVAADGQRPFAPRRLRLLGIDTNYLRRIVASSARDSLERLDLRESPQCYRDLGRLRDLPRLRSLLVEGATFPREGLDGLGALAGLQELHVLHSFEGIETTEVFRADAPAFDDPALAALAKLRKLRVLQVPGAKFSDGAMVAARLGDAWPELEVLNLSGAPQLTGRGLSAFAGHPRLRRLVLRDLPALADDGLRGLAGLPALRELDLDGGRPRVGPDDRITPRALEHLAALPNLDELRLGYWFSRSRPKARGRAVEVPGDHGDRHDLPDAWRAALAALLRSPGLRRLSLHHGPDLRAADLEALASVPALREIDLNQCPQLGAPELEALRGRFRGRVLGSH